MVIYSFSSSSLHSISFFFLYIQHDEFLCFQKGHTFKYRTICSIHFVYLFIFTSQHISLWLHCVVSKVIMLVNDDTELIFPCFSMNGVFFCDLPQDEISQPQLCVLLCSSSTVYLTLHYGCSCVYSPSLLPSKQLPCLIIACSITTNNLSSQLCVGLTKGRKIGPKKKNLKLVTN